MSPGHLLPVLGLLGLGVGDSDDKIHVALHMVLILMTSWYICTFFTSKCFCIHQAWICTPLSIPGPEGLASSCILPPSLPSGVVVTCCLALITLFESLQFVLEAWQSVVLILVMIFLSAMCDDTSL